MENIHEIKDCESVDCDSNPESMESVILSEVLNPDRHFRHSKNFSVHKGCCNICLVSPIIGSKFSCDQCNIDVCELCENIFEHPHPFLKIKRPSRSNLSLVDIEDAKYRRPSGKVISLLVDQMKKLGLEDPHLNISALIKNDYCIPKAICSVLK